MKKVLFILAMAVSVSSLQAQVKFGPKAGANYSNVVGADAEGSKAQAGFYGGVQAQIPVYGNLSVQPEVVFSAQGAKYSEEGQSDVKVNMSYLQVPVLLKFTSNAGFFAESGPQIGYLLNAKASMGGQKADVKEAFKKTDLSWAFGVGYMTPANIGINARYNMGLSRIDEEDEAKVKTSVFQAGIFFIIGGNGK